MLLKKGVELPLGMSKFFNAAKVDSLNVPIEYLLGKVVSADVIDTDTGEILLNANSLITEELIEVLTTAKIKKTQYYFYQ